MIKWIMVGCIFLIAQLSYTMDVQQEQNNGTFKNEEDLKRKMIQYFGMDVVEKASYNYGKSDVWQVLYSVYQEETSKQAKL